MKVRIAIAAFLFVVGVALPLAAVAKKGLPWGYRGHAAVLLEATGNAELMASEDRRVRQKNEDAHIANTAGTFLDAGDEVRVGRYGQARLRMPGGDIDVDDGARIVIGAGTFTIARGLVEVRLPAGATTPLEVKVDGVDVRLTVRPGGGGGAVRLLADGAGEVRALVVNGSCEAQSPAGDEIAENGKVVVVEKGQKPRVESAPTAVDMKAACDGKKLTLDVTPGVQVFAAGKIAYAAEAKAGIDVTGPVEIFARDLAGNVARAHACDAKPAKK